MNTLQHHPIFELHMTPHLGSKEQVELFMTQCNAHNIKTFLVDNGMNKVSTHLMTSVVCKGAEALATAKTIIEKITKETGLLMARSKIEVPMRKDFDYVSGDNYYEVHVELDLQGMAIEDVPFDNTLWSYSHRPDKAQGMLTMRARNITAPVFRQKAEDSMKEFEPFIKDKGVQFEKCISDTNAKMDADWMIGY